jgi:transposase
VRTDHPLRKIRKLVRDVLGELNRSLSRLYASEGRPSIPPEQLLSALLLQVFYGIRSECQLMDNWTTIFCTAGSWDFRPTT